jgi:uncharacterized membrane protein YeaQ/YmgE (transglycosylase-associated protein family)
VAFDPAWTSSLEQGAHEILVWVGFGTIVGLTAKAIMPGRDPGGAVGTLVMGVVGAVIGCGSLAFFTKTVKISPISSWGFVASTAGAFLLLACYRLFSGSFVRETEDRWSEIRRKPARRRGAVVHEVWTDRRAG